MNHGLLGRTGTLTGQDLLESLRTLRCSGTLSLGSHDGTMLLQLARGQVEASYKLGSYEALDRPEQSFHLYRHEPADVPRLPGLVPTSSSPLLRALPRLAPPLRIVPGLIDLRALLDRLQEDGFNGALSRSTDDESLAVLLVGGRVAAAVHEQNGVVHERSSAMRALQRAGMDVSGPPLQLDRLDALVARSLLGLAQGWRLEASTDTSTFDGVALDPGGVRFVRGGQAYLHVDASGWPSMQRFGLAKVDAVGSAGAAAAGLELPNEPPGWEDQRYSLTLRGQDALNPMTELSMAFDDGYGRTGHQVLENLSHGNSLAQVAERLRLDLQDLKKWLQRLEGDGLVRAQPH